MSNRFKNITVTLDDTSTTIKLLSPFGSGAYSEVYSTSNPDYVAKIISISDPRNTRVFASEKYAFLHLKRHSNLVFSGGLGHFQLEGQNFVAILLQFCSASLINLLTCFASRDMPESMLLEIALQIANGLKELHTANPPITHRDIKLENILIGKDGLLKICDFGSVSNAIIREIDLSNRQNINEELESVTTPNYRSPEIVDLYSGYEIGPKSDLWAMGCLLYMLAFKKPPFEGKLAIVNCHYMIPKESVYTENFLGLLKRLLTINPALRFSSQETVGFLTGMGVSKNRSFLEDLKAFSSAKQGKIRPKIIDTLKKHYNRVTTKTKGWVLSALEENEEGPKQKYVRYLIIKAWQKPNKIGKFYSCLHEILRKHQDSCVLVLKSLLILHNYFKKGPPEVLTLNAKDISPLDLLSKVSSKWHQICETKMGSPKDKRRTHYLSTLVFDYSELLKSKVRLSLTHASFFEGNFSLSPFFKNRTPLSFQMIEDLLFYLKKLCDFSAKLMIENSLWKIQLSLVISIIDEAWCLLSLLAFLIYALKSSTNYIDDFVHGEKLREKVYEFEGEFEDGFRNMKAFFRKCKNLGEVQKDLVPELKEEVIEIIKGLKLLEKQDGKYNMFKDLNNTRVIVNMKLPISYGITAKSAPIEKMIGADEHLQNSVNPSSSSLIHNSKVDFSQFLCTKASFEKELPVQEKEKETQSQNISKFEEKMIFEGFNFGAEDKFLQIARQDQAAKDIYCDFSHNGLQGGEDTNPSELKIGENEQENLITFENFMNFLHNQQNKLPEDSPEKKENANNQVLEFSSQEEQKSIIELEVKEENNRNSDLKALNQIFGQEPKKLEISMTMEDNRGLESPKAQEEYRFTALSENLTGNVNLINFGNNNENQELLQKENNPFKKEELPIQIQKLFENSNLSEDISSFIIPYSRLTFLSQIGSGSTSIVYLGLIAPSPTSVAIKKIKFAEISENNILEFQREISALMKLKTDSHELNSNLNLVGFLGVSFSNADICIITEFCGGGTLFDLLHRKKNIELTWQQRIKFSIDVCRGIKVLHGCNPPIIHRDLKSLNLLLDEKVENPNDFSTVKIADFGLARNTFGSNVDKMTGLMGTFHWMAPEIFENKPYSLKADIYSLGIILWEICARETPYKNLKGPHAIMKYVTVDQGRPSLEVIPSDCPKKLIELFQRCWEHDPNKRPKIEEVLELLEIIEKEI